MVMYIQFLYPVACGRAPHSVFWVSLAWLSVILTRAETWQTSACLQGEKVVGKREHFEKSFYKKLPVSVIVQPWSGAWWSLSLLKHEYNLLIRLWPASPAKIWTRCSFWFSLLTPTPTADSLWSLPIHPHRPYPLPPPPIHSQSSFTI